METIEKTEVVFVENPFIVPCQEYAAAIDNELKEKGGTQTKEGKGFKFESILHTEYPAKGWHFCRFTTPANNKFYLRATDEGLEDIIIRIDRGDPLF